MTDPLKLARSFGRAVDAYDRGRPGYGADAVAWLLEPVASVARRPRVADVGAGTGKLTRALVDAGAEAVAIDPDAEMLAALRDTTPGVPTFVGTGERMPLPDASVDAVVFGQTWHWVDAAAASTEAGRVLRDGGVLGLVWNLRDETVPWVARLTRIMRGSHAEELLAEGDPPVHAPFGALERRSWSWTRPVSRDDLRAMVFSRSYVITAPEAERARIEREIAELFDEIGAVGDTEVDLPYVTHAYRAVKPAGASG